MPTVGIFCLDLNLSIEAQAFVIHQFPWCSSASGKEIQTKIELSVPSSIADIRCNFNNAMEVPTSKLNACVTVETSAAKLLSTVNGHLKNKLTKKELFQKILSISDFKDEVNNFETVLSNAVKKRVEFQLNLCKECYTEVYEKNSAISCHHSHIGVLFSGGLDSLVIAYLASRYVYINHCLLLHHALIN